MNLKGITYNIYEYSYSWEDTFLLTDVSVFNSLYI